MGRQVIILVLASFALAVCLSGCKKEEPTTPEPSKQTNAAPVKEGAKQATGAPVAGTNPNANPQDIENRAGSALK